MRSALLLSFFACVIGGSLLLTHATVAQSPQNVRAAAFLESETEDEREERELARRRQRIEQIIDPDQRQREMELLEQVEANRRARLARRQRDEVGADLFYFPRLRDSRLNEGWCQLFDGHTDFGWIVQTEGPYGGGKFTFEAGEIRSDPEHPGMIYTAIPFGEIQLRFDYWAARDSEAFLLLNSPPNPVDLEKDCYAFVLNSALPSRPRGLLLGRHGLTQAELRALRASSDNPTNEQEGSWHTVTVGFTGGNIQFWLDTRSPETYIESQPLLSGHIAFLVTSGSIRIQNIHWMPNQPTAIFDTDDFREGIPWKASDEGGYIDGIDQATMTRFFRLLSGSIESRDTYTNYMMQVQYRQENASGRSSLFVRSLPGRENTGYEISLQNFPRRADREADRGVDAGGFLGAQDARYIRPLDNHWNHLTVVVMGRQIQTWVNGVPVSKIKDRRTISTPTGPFLGPGTIRFSTPPDNSEFQFRRLTVLPVQ